MNQSKLDELEASRIKLADRLVAETERGLRADMKRIDEIGRLMQDEEYREIYNLTCYLLTTYNGSGKTFFLRAGCGRTAIPVPGIAARAHRFHSAVRNVSELRLSQENAHKLAKKTCGIFRR